MLSVINIFLNFCVRGIKSSKAERAEFIRKTLIWPYLGRKWPKIRVYLTYRHVWKLQIDHVKLAGCSQICRVMPKGQILSKFVVNVHVCVSGDKKCSFFGKFDVLFFLETPVLRLALSPYYRRIANISVMSWGILLIFAASKLILPF